MEKEEWKKRYIERLIERGLNKHIAEGMGESALEDWDSDSDPEMAADDELSYWAADSSL